MIEALKIYNKYYMQNHILGDLESPEIYRFTDRKSSLIFSAPHTTKNALNGKVKSSDLFTGPLVQYLGEQTGTSTIIRTRYDEKETWISDLIKEKHLENHYFLDIHGFDKHVGYDIYLGTGDMSPENYPHLKQIAEIAEKHDLKVGINPFNYRGSKGVTGRYQRLFHKPNIIQIELYYDLRDFREHTDLYEQKTIPFFKNVIRYYQENERQMMKLKLQNLAQSR